MYRSVASFQLPEKLLWGPSYQVRDCTERTVSELNVGLVAGVLASKLSTISTNRTFCVAHLSLDHSIIS